MSTPKNPTSKQTPSPDSTGTTDGESQAFDINDSDRSSDGTGDELQSRFAEDDQGEAWKINENTVGEDG